MGVETVDFVFEEPGPSGVVVDDEPGQAETGGAAGEPAAGTGKKQDEPDAKATAAELAAMRRENARLAKSLEEVTTSERYWADQAKGKLAPAAEPEAADEWETEDPEKLVDDFSKNGAKALKARGFVSRKEVDALVSKKAAEIAEGISAKAVQKAMNGLSADIQFASANPELRDPKAPFTQRVKEIMETDPEFEDLPVGARLKVATRLARAEFGTRPATADDEEPAQPPTRRSQPAVFDRSRQPGGGGGSAVTATQMAILRGMGVDPKAFAKTRHQMGVK